MKTSRRMAYPLKEKVRLSHVQADMPYRYSAANPERLPGIRAYSALGAAQRTRVKSFLLRVTLLNAVT